MRILIDGDGCPNRYEVIELAKLYQKEVIIFVDYAHVIQEDCKVIYCDVAKDSVDMQISQKATKGDIVITQDYGLASLLLMKDVIVLHVSGQVITHDNIDVLLGFRYVSAKIRKQGKYLKGPSARTKEKENYFLNQLEKFIKTEDIYEI